MAEMERVQFAKRLPPPGNWKTRKAQRTAIRLANRIGEWAKIAYYPADETGERTARQRAYATPRSRAWKEIGDFVGKVRYDAEDNVMVVWIKCVRRNRDGATERKLEDDRAQETD